MMPPVQPKMTQAGTRQAWMKRSRWVLPLVVLTGFAAFLLVRPHQPIPSRESFQVSQRGREFKPELLNVGRGDVVEIVNDDGDLSHHAYVSSERFKFDSGDQEPGGRADIAFTVAGTFNVLCGIHPKMRLVVKVQ